MRTLDPSKIDIPEHVRKLYIPVAFRKIHHTDQFYLGIDGIVRPVAGMKHNQLALILEPIPPIPLTIGIPIEKVTRFGEATNGTLILSASGRIMPETEDVSYRLIIEPQYREPDFPEDYGKEIEVKDRDNHEWKSGILIGKRTQIDTYVWIVENVHHVVNCFKIARIAE